MNSKKSCVCACCGNRVSLSERRPLNGNCIRLFVATRLFPTCLSTDGFICNKCRLMYNKWRYLPEFRDVFIRIDECHQMRTEAAQDNAEETEVNEECMEDENECDHLVDDASSEAHLSDNGSSDDQPMDTSSSEEENEDEEMYSNKGEEESEDKEMDEEINSDESNEAVSSILHPRHFSIFLCRHGRV